MTRAENDKFIICPVCKEKIKWELRFKHRCLFKNLHETAQRAEHLYSHFTGKRYVGPSTGG